MDKKVLIVDDAMFMRMMLKNAIAEAGSYEVSEAKSGQEALELYPQLQPGLVFLDISMPEMNGIEVLKKLHEMDPEAFVIMCSAIGQDNMICEAFDSGARDFIVKPFTKEQIKAALELAFSQEDEE